MTPLERGFFNKIASFIKHSQASKMPSTTSVPGYSKITKGLSRANSISNYNSRPSSVKSIGGSRQRFSPINQERLRSNIVKKYNIKTPASRWDPRLIGTTPPVSPGPSLMRNRNQYNASTIAGIRG